MAFFDLDLLCKGCRQLVGILAWTWAILVFLLSYFGRGHYNHINNNNEFGPPPFFHAVFVPVLKVLVVAPSGSFGASINEGVVATPGSVGHHGNVQSGQRRFLDDAVPAAGVYCAGCTGDDGNSQSVINVASILPQQNVPTNLNPPQVYNVQINADPNVDIKNNKGFAFANNPLIDRIGEGNVNAPGSQDPASVQYINMNQDGQYSFAYTAKESSRQERRNSDGSVEGSYSYTNPEGRLVEIQYSAGDQGFNAYGDNVPPRQISYQPVPVQDTPAVKAAREEFLNTYAKELNRINSAKAQEGQNQLQLQTSQVQSVPQPQLAPTVPIILPQNLQQQDSQPAPSGVSQLSSLANNNNQNNNQKPVQDTFDDEDDTEIVYSALANSYKADHQEDIKSNEGKPSIILNEFKNKPAPVQSSFGFWQKETVTPGARAPVPNIKKENSNQLPAYFYYVGVGGLPYYVTSNDNALDKSSFPTSLKATLLGAIPASAVHDAQVRHSGNKIQQTSSPPVYLDLNANKENNNNNNINNFNGQLLPIQQNTQNPSGIMSFQTVNSNPTSQSQNGASSLINLQQPSPSFSHFQIVGLPVYVV